MATEFTNTPLKWDNEGIEPPEELKTNGWEAGYKPPAEYFNYDMNNRYNVEKEIQEKLKAHADSTNNPHKVTKAQVGLGNVDNTSDVNKPISTAMQTALNGKADDDHTHTLDEISETTDKKIMTAAERTKLSGIATGANKTTVDASLSGTSKNPVQNNVVKAELDKKANKSDIPTSLKNPNALTVKVGSTTTTYDGSSAKSVEINASSVGAAASSHTHTLSSLSGSVTLSQMPKGTENYILTGTGTSTAPTWKEPLIKNLEGETVSTEYDTTVTAGTKAIVICDVRERKYNSNPDIHNVTAGNVASGNYSLAEGCLTTASGNYSHAEGSNTTASGNYSHAEGSNTTASENHSHAEGYSTTASGSSSHAEGSNTTASISCSHAEGSNTTASGYNSHAEGLGTLASGTNSHAEGNGTTASGYCGHAGGISTIANRCQYAIGQYNISSDGPNSVSSSNGDVFIVGNGNSESNRSNAFRISNDGHCYGQYSFGASGADFAEYFEWIDGNSENADRRGLFVTLDGEKIRLANPNDDYILGVVSAVPTVIGDTQSETWKDMYLKDVFGEPITEVVTVPESTDEATGEVIPEHTETRFILNPDYDSTKEYVSRDKRPEWAAVGLVGKLVVVDDGTCEVNGYCKVADGGIATKSDMGYRVMSRLDDTHIKILIK